MRKQINKSSTLEIMKNLKLNKLAASFFIAAGIFYTSANADMLDGSVYKTVAQKEGVDPLLLYAISLTEAAAAAGDRQNVKPHIYAIRTPDGALYPKDLNEAKVSLDKAIRKYGARALDVGLMQINGQHWQNLDKPPYALFSAQYNVTFGARILKKALETAPDNLTLGVGHYHSFTDWRAQTYGNRVLAVYRNLKNLQ